MSLLSPPILLAEDSPTQAADLRMILESEGFSVDIARDGISAHDKFKSGAYVLVMTDIVMPGMTGYELCRRIKADPVGKNIPVILMTTLSDPEDIMQGLACGADNFIPKPFKPDQLLLRVRNVLANRTAMSQAKAPSLVFRLLGRTVTINQDRQQILGLLISSFEEAVRRSEDLRESQSALAAAKGEVERYARALEARVKLSEDKYRILVENASDAIFVLDLKGRILEANRKTEDLLGCLKAEILGSRYQDFVPSSSGGPAEEALLEILRKGAGEVKSHCLRRSDGSIRFVDMSISTVDIGAERVGLGIARDVTQQRREFEEHAAGEKQMIQLLDCLPVAVYVLDRDGKAFYSNPLAVELLGGGIMQVTDFTTLAETYRAYVTDSDRLYSSSDLPIVKALAGEESSVSDMQIRRPGRTIDLEVSAAPIHAADGTVAYAVAIFRDITERRRSAESLAKIQEQLLQSQKMDALGKLAGGVAHDFNNYLSVIRGSAEMLLADLRDAAHKSSVEEIITAADRSAELTRQLLAFGRRQTFVVEVIDLNEAVRNMERLLVRILPETIAVKTQLSKAVASVKVDPGQIQQVIMNLAVNARDAMPRGGTLIIETSFADLDESYAATHMAVIPGQYVCLTMTDTGDGMDASTRERIFEPFFTTKERGKGTGLGLATVYGIVKQSRGNIWVYSEPAIGTTFKVYLPIVMEAPAPRKIPPVAPVGLSGGQKTILLVEDQAPLRAVARRILGRAGYVVLEAASGEEAIRFFDGTKDPIHLVLTDVVMPGMTGPELYAILESRYRNIKVIYMSGHTEMGMGENGLLSAGTPFLQKPFTVAELTEKIQEAIHG
ncbi:MAG: response regulator [Candidatus Hydrogenedentota bacterium]